jgi:hypothetical protein
MWIVNGRQTTNERRRTTGVKWWQKLTLPLARWANNSHWVDMSLHSNTLFWFRANQSLLFLLNAAFLAEKQQIPILYLLFVWQYRGSYQQFIALEASTLVTSDGMVMILYRTYNSFSLFARQLDYCIFKECLIKSRNSHCLYRYQVTLIVLD